MALAKIGSRLRSRLSYSNVTATIALFIALGGSAYAATQLPKNSIGSSQLRRNAVTSPKVKDGSLLLRDFNGKERKSLQGAAGPQGLQGAAGAPGATNVVVRRTDAGALAAETSKLVVARCAPGERATGGGAAFTENANHEIVEQSGPVSKPAGFELSNDGETPVAWETRIKNGNAGPLSHTLAFVICARP